jgi:lipoyl(octanoyl) transferase
MLYNEVMKFDLFDLGLTEYAKAWEFQKEIFQKVKNGLLNSSLILCQHHPVITLGRLAKAGNVLSSSQELKRLGIQVYRVERGGDVTYHGPGQLTAYPIFNLNQLKKDIHWFLRRLEGVVIDFLSDFGLEAARNPGLTGVWVYSGSGCAIKKKIASIGIAIKNWVSFHGLTININNKDLENFKIIRPCGMDIEVTSMENILGRYVEIDEIKTCLISKFEHIFAEDNL